MKKLLSIFLVLISLSSYSQDVSMRNIDIHLPKYQAQKKEGIAFMITGMVIATAGGIIATQTKGPDSHDYGQAVVVIGSAFSFYGIFRALESDRHRKKSDAWEKRLAGK